MSIQDKHITIPCPRLLNPRIMAKTYRHIAMSVFFALAYTFVVSIVLVEVGASVTSFGIIGVSSVTLMAIFGVPIDKVQKGEWVIEFADWGPSFPPYEGD